MMHKNRIWGIGAVASADELAAKLTGSTWTLCTGFYVADHPDYLFLNDATCEDGAGEYGVVKRFPDGTMKQLESITFSWCDKAKALEFINLALAGGMDNYDFAFPVTLAIEEKHERCRLCA